MEAVISEPATLSVSELTARIKIILEGGLPVCWIKGEISQLTSHRSGHLYFTLSDEKSQVSGVLWRGRSEGLSFQPKVGDLILALGKVVVYERGGRYQFDCLELRPAGVGNLAQAFEALKRKLAEEGLFNLDRKIPLPLFPERLGLVTSPDGAALQDILKVAQKRAPWVEFQLVPVHVQGTEAPREIARAIQFLDASGWSQIIIIGRGGGAPEDLWAFNDAAVIRAIAGCRTPLVSAVGHEVDVTLADLAADLRAPTPSAAAEICLPDRETLQNRLSDAESRLDRLLQQKITEIKRWLLNHATLILQSRLAGLWRESSQRLDEVARRLDGSLTLLLERRRSRLEQLQVRHHSLDPSTILSHGYSIVRLAGSPQPITDANLLQAQDHIQITFHRGRAEAQVVATETNLA